MFLRIWLSRKLTLIFHFEKWDTDFEDINYNEYRIYVLLWEINFLVKKK